MKKPHLLKISSNPIEMKENLTAILPDDSIKLIQKEIDENAKELFLLGESHYKFAKKLSNNNWRQKVSRYYYGVFNVLRAVRLLSLGIYRTDVSDHKSIKLPSDFPNYIVYAKQCGSLRDDRNLADYDHTGSVGDLILGLNDTLMLSEEIVEASRTYLNSRGLNL